MRNSLLLRSGIFVLSLLTSVASLANGMIPETSVVIVEQSDGEGTMNVKNSDNHPLLLITNLQNIADDNVTSLLVVSPPAARVEPGKSQQIRFILKSNAPLKTEHLGRATFEGVPPQVKDGNVVQMNIRQNLPLIIRPAGLAKDETPWKRLKWQLQGNQMLVSNDSPYVIRLNQKIVTLPENTGWTLPNTYILPGQKLTIKPDNNKTVGVINAVRLYPATTWGYAVASYDAPLM